MQLSSAPLSTPTLVVRLPIENSSDRHTLRTLAPVSTTIQCSHCVLIRPQKDPCGVLNTQSASRHEQRPRWLNTKQPRPCASGTVDRTRHSPGGSGVRRVGLVVVAVGTRAAASVTVLSACSIASLKNACPRLMDTCTTYDANCRHKGLVITKHREVVLVRPEGRPRYL